MSISDVRVDRLKKLSDLLKKPKEEWPSYPGDGIPSFDLGSWSTAFFEEALNEYNDKVYDVTNVCKTTACACGLYAIAYPEDGLLLGRYGKNIVDNKINDVIGVGDDEYIYRESVDLSLYYKESEHYLFSGQKAVVKFFGLFGIQINYILAHEFFFMPRRYHRIELHNPLAVAKRIDAFLDALENGKFSEAEDNYTYVTC